MKNLIILFLSIFLFISCSSKDYKWEIHNPSYLNTGKPAIFFTDTIMTSGDTLYWINSDESKIIISTKNGQDCKFIKK